MRDVLQCGLPANVETEKFVLGSILLAGASQFEIVAEGLSAEDFATERHSLIWRRMADLYRRGEPIDRVTVANEIVNRNESGVCDLGYLISLDDGMPVIPNLDGYVRIVQQKALRRRAIVAAQGLIDRCLSGPDDSESVLSDAEAVLSKLADSSGKRSYWLNCGEIIQQYPGGINAFMQPAAGGIGIPTPWDGLTGKLCGLHPGDLFLVAGRPSMGKSVVGMQLAHYAAAEGHGAAVFSLEMTKESLVRRLISAVGKVDAQRLRTGELTKDEIRKAAAAASAINELPLWIDDTRARTIPAVTSALRKLTAKHPVRLVVIDHLQLMKGATGRFESRHQELSEISHSLKHLAGQLNLTVVLLSQLNRECEKAARRPQLSDLKETGSLEEDADVVLFVHRPEQYNRQDATLRGKAEFIIGKQRNGPTGKRDMVFRHEYQRFDEATGWNDRGE